MNTSGFLVKQYFMYYGFIGLNSHTFFFFLTEPPCRISAEDVKTNNVNGQGFQDLIFTGVRLFNMQVQNCLIAAVTAKLHVR